MSSHNKNLMILCAGYAKNKSTGKKTVQNVSLIIESEVQIHAYTIWSNVCRQFDHLTLEHP